MKKIEKTGNQIVFEAEINETLANAVRRYVNQIPVMAVDEVEISKNDSPLYDETIAHRIGLLPLKTDKSITKKSTGKLKLEIKKEGTIYSGDIRGKPEVVYKNMPLTILSKNPCSTRISVRSLDTFKQTMPLMLSMAKKKKTNKTRYQKQ